MVEVNPSQRPVFPSYEHPIDNARWTTARCLRLLRPITARVKKLRKAKENHPQFGIRVEKEQSAAAEATGGHRVKAVYNVSGASDDDQDPEWILPQQTSYGRRGKSAGATAPQPRGVSGRLNVLTPVIARALECNDLARFAVGTGELSADSEDKPFPGQVKQPSRYTLRLKQLRKRTDQSTWQLYSSLCHGYESLLKATASPENFYVKPSGETRERVGTRSLLSMCLRRMPEYIELEEKSSDTQALDDYDLASSIYSEIEELGCSEKGGWRGLREIVRSHGTKILSNALQDYILSEDLGELLVWISVDKGAYDEAEEIISAMLSVARLTWPTTADISIVSRLNSLPVYLLFSFTRITQRFSFRFRELGALFGSGRLYKEWLAHEDFSEVWQAAIQALSEQSPHFPAAMNFVAIALEITLGIRLGQCASQQLSEVSDTQATWIQRFEKPLDNTVYSVTTALTSIAVLNQRFFEIALNTRNVASDKVTPALHLIQILCIDILRTFQASPDPATWVRHAVGVSQRILPALLSGLLILPSFDGNLRGSKGGSIANCLTVLIYYQESQKLSSFRAGNQRSVVNAGGHTPAIDHLSYFINSLSECCARATQDGGFVHITYLIERLQHVLDSAPVRQRLGFEGRCNVAKIALESAYEFADQDRKIEHFEWAEGIDRWMVREGHAKSAITPAKSHRPQQPNPWHFGSSIASPQLARKSNIPQRVGFRKLQPNVNRKSKRQRDEADGPDEEGSNYSDSDDTLPDNKRQRRRMNEVSQALQTPRISKIMSPLEATPWTGPEHVILSSPTDELSRVDKHAPKASSPLSSRHNIRVREQAVLCQCAVNANQHNEDMKRHARVGKENTSSDVDELSVSHHRDVEKPRAKIAVKELNGRESKKVDKVRKLGKLSVSRGPLAEKPRTNMPIAKLGGELMKLAKRKDLKQPGMSKAVRTVKQRGPPFRSAGHQRERRVVDIFSEDELLG